MLSAPKRLDVGDMRSGREASAIDPVSRLQRNAEIARFRIEQN